MAEQSDSSSERQIIATSLRALGAEAVRNGWAVPIGNSLWSSRLYTQGIFPTEGTPVEIRKSFPGKKFAKDWVTSAEVVINSEEILATGSVFDPVAPVDVTQSLGYTGEDMHALGDFSVHYSVFPDRVDRFASAIIGPKTDVAMGEEWFRMQGVLMSEVSVSQVDGTGEVLPSSPIQITQIPAAEFAELATRLLEQ